MLTGILQAGIFENACKPPATPSSLAAVPVPTMAERFGARMFMRELTYAKIFIQVMRIWR
jgi:hypothetical protein